MPLDFYTSLSARSDGYFEEKKSRFLAFAAPISGEAEAVSFVDGIKKAHYDARHVAFAFVLPDGAFRSSDAGEPSGSAGVPILDVLRGFGSIGAPTRGVCVAVARYFGGTLLGVGGLVRAYGGAASDSLDKAAKIKFERRVTVGFACSYADYGKIADRARADGIIIRPPTFGQTIEVAALTPPVVTERFCVFLTETSAGKITPKLGGEEWVVGE